MKRFFHIIGAIICLYVLPLSPLSAQKKLIMDFDHMIEVGRYPYYAKDYLIVTDTHERCISYYFMRNGRQETETSYFRPYHYTGKDITLGAIILSVNGISTKNMDKREFYATIDSCDGESVLEIMGYNPLEKTGNLTEKYRVSITPIYDYPEELQAIRILRQEYVMGFRWNINRDASLKSRYDPDFDFASIKTYDFMITSNNPLWDKEIMSYLTMMSLKRDTENPDLVVSISRRADENISTTYVPATSHVVYEGSVTRPYYSYITRQTEYRTTNNSRTVYEREYTVDTKTTDVYLEVTALDASKLNDPNQQYAPVVWNSIYNKHYTDSGNTAGELLNYAAHFISGPIRDRICETWATLNRRREDWDYFYAIPFGIEYFGNENYSGGLVQLKKNDVITKVYKGSLAERMGLKPGDKFLKFAIDTLFEGIKTQKTCWAHSNDFEITSNSHDGFTLPEKIQVLRDGKKIWIDIPRAWMSVTGRVLVDAE